ncbi:MAG: rRNA maturation RNase YbeY [Tannerella sp.]|jgi:rRNA maturation RNase YbeY|nr:rRNA maturation RNase YbeY [Tannerella sp.]
MISYNSENTKIPNIPRRKVSAWIRDIAAQNGKRTGEIAYIFCSDERILEINNQYLNHDYYTDIITFDYSENKTISGDIFISLETVVSNAEKFNTTSENELYRIIIHGILHLCGFKDKSALDEKIMREKENEALQMFEAMNSSTNHSLNKFK